MILQHMRGETGPCDDMLCASNGINDGTLCNSLVNLTFLEEASKSKPSLLVHLEFLQISLLCIHIHIKWFIESRSKVVPSGVK